MDFVQFVTGGAIFFPRGGVGRHIARGEGSNTATAGTRGFAPAERRARAAPPVAAPRRRPRLQAAPAAAHAAQH